MTGPVSAIEVEMNLYRETARVNRFEDPMKWWRQHSNVITKFARLAKRHIGIPATSVPSERVFSKAGELVSARRSRLKQSNVDILILNTKKCLTLVLYPVVHIVDG